MLNHSVTMIDQTAVVPCKSRNDKLTEGSMRVRKVRCADIRPDPDSRGYHPQEVEPLAEDIRNNGVLRPVLLRETPAGYVIVHGERRWRAAAAAGLDSVPALVVQDLTRRDAVAA